MAKYSAVKATVNAYIKQNGRKEITGRILNAVLNATIDSLGKYFQFAGGALPTDDPGTPDQNVCYLAGEPGVYTNFGGITIENEEVALLFWDGEWTKQRILIGIREVNASVDNQVGTPSVDVSYSGGELVLTFHNLKGEQGETGDPAGFGTIGADINGGVGTPGVSVETSGDNTAKNLMFHFTNLKGETGVTSVVATIDDTSGTPSCQVSLVGQQLTLAFSGLKGLKGDTGVSADYPITIYNGLDSDATDQALAAAQGKVLDGKVSQLGQDVDDIENAISESDTISVKTTKVAGLKMRTAGLTADANAVLYYFPATAGVRYGIAFRNSTGIIRICRTTGIPAVGVSVSNYTTKSSSELSMAITPSEDCYICIGHDTGFGTGDPQVTTAKTSGIGLDVKQLKEDVVEQEQKIADIIIDNEETDNAIWSIHRDITEGGEYINPEVEVVNNLIASDGAFAANNSYDTKYFRVKKGDVVVATSNYSCYTAMSLIPPSIGVAYTHLENVQTLWDNTELEMPEDGYFCISYARVHLTTLSLAIKNTNTIARRVTLLESQGYESLEDKVITPSVIYDIFPNSGFMALNRIYAEGIINDATIENVRIDGKTSRVIGNIALSNSVNEYTQNIKVSATGYATLTIPVSIKRADPAIVSGSKLRIMCIGDSLTIGGYPALVDYIFQRLQSYDNGISAVLVGHRIYNNTITYNGVTKTCRGCNEGLGGCGISDYMRHLFMVRSSGTDVRYGGTITGKTAWDSLGLGTRTRNGSAGQVYVDWTGSDEQKELLRTTCHGWYDADPSAELWQYITTILAISSFTYGGVTYTFGDSYSSTENEKIVKCVKWMCESDDFTKKIPFYDYASVLSSNGAYSFSMTAYLAKYKTLSDDGETRLVRGSTAGTMVTDVDAFDVCTPNYISILMDHNDLNQYGNVQGNIDDILLMAQISKAQTSAKIVLMSNRAYGVNDVVEYQDLGNFGKFGLAGVSGKLLSYYTILKSSIPAGYDFIDLYHLQSPIGATFDAVDTIDGNDSLATNRFDGATHSTLKRYIDRAFQVAAWAICSNLE